MNDVTTPDGRVFYWLANIPHARKDQSLTELAVWHSACAVCGSAFTVATPANPKASNAFGRKHCDEHKLTAEQIRANWADAVRAGVTNKKNKAG